MFSLEDYVLEQGAAQLVQGLWPQYVTVEPNLATIESYVHRPLMIGEYSSISPSPTDPSTTASYAHWPNQQERAQANSTFLASLYQSAPWLVGDDWFEYVDEPQNGRTGDGENNNFGMVNVNDQPYPTMVASMEEMHAEIAPDRLVQTGVACDSWAAGTGGVTCTATMPPVPGPFPLSIPNNTPLVTAEQGSSYTGLLVYLTAAGGDPGASLVKPAYTFAVSQGSLPSGLKLDARTGQIKGTPKGTGTSAFSVTATDAVGQQASSNFSIQVLPRGTPYPY